ncbi:hydroxyacid dehydrogenase [Micromonospora globbae]|uniref:hydroxyacid dehydrogenase n=1 Tax=Micromonospora globbae TaxID=1894969 RepID=UPI00343326F9
MSKRYRAVLAMRPSLPERLFTAATRQRLRDLLDIDVEHCLDTFDGDRADRALAEAQILVTGWGSPRLGPQVLARAPQLAAVAHAGGSVKPYLDAACWARGIAVCTAASVNALPVAEYTLAMILLAGKGAFQVTRLYQQRRAPVDLLDEFPRIGNYRRRVGIVGASRIGRRVIDLLRAFDVAVAVHDPYLDDAGARDLGVQSLSLDELMCWSEVLSLHAPAIPETRHMIDARRLALLPDGATLINTARGSLVDQDALVAELTTGRLAAVLDVTVPEVLPADSPLYHLPNVVLTPHLAGAMGNELHRLGDWVADEVERFVQGRPFAAPVRVEDLDRMA